MIKPVPNANRLPVNFGKGDCEFLTAIFQYLNFLNKSILLDNPLGTKRGS
jgi:hypothetical protein